MTYRIRTIALAVALAVVAAFLTLYYVRNYKRNVQRGESNSTVYVAARDIPAGRTGADVLEQKLLVPSSVARRTVVPGAISSPNQIKGLVALQPTYAGEQLSTRRFGPPAARGVYSKLKGTLRAIEVPGTANQVLAGTIRAGDRVDVVASFEVPEGAQHHVSRIVLRDILVLRAPKVGPASSRLASPAQSHAALLAVSDTQVQKLFWVVRNGDWSLQLRATVDPADSPESVEDAMTLLRDGLPKAAEERPTRRRRR